MMILLSALAVAASMPTSSISKNSGVFLVILIQRRSLSLAKLKTSLCNLSSTTSSFQNFSIFLGCINNYNSNKRIVNILSSPEELCQFSKYTLGKVVLVSIMRVEDVSRVKTLSHLHYLPHQFSSDLRRIERRFYSR